MCCVSLSVNLKALALYESGIAPRSLLLLLLLLLFITFLQGIYNYIPETNNVFGVYSVATIL
jgi:hypothetical protein